jgi:hypothetical protein
MKAPARATLLWTKWLGGAALVLALLALLLIRERGEASGGDGDSQSSSWATNAPASSTSLARTKQAASSNVPRFQVEASDKPEERHFQALLAKQRARATGGRIPSTPELFEGEARDPVWAPAMERALGNRMQRARELLTSAGFEGTRIKTSECRTSSCRLEFEYTDRDEAKGRENGTLKADERPYGYLVRETGPWATLSSDLKPEPIEVVDGVTRFRKTVYVVFGEQESNPDRYATWVAEAQRQQAEYLKTAPAVKIRGLPPPEQR